MNIGNVASIDLAKQFDYVAKDNNLCQIYYWMNVRNQGPPKDKWQKRHRLQWKGKSNRFTCVIQFGVAVKR